MTAVWSVFSANVSGDGQLAPFRKVAAMYVQLATVLDEIKFV
jgi:hypothetical protein